MKIRTALIGLAAAGAMVVAAAGPASAGHGAGSTTVGLNGANEVPEKGARNGSGQIAIDFFTDAGGEGLTPVAFPGEYYLCYDLVTRNIGEITGAHIHEVARGAGDDRTNARKLNGPVVVDLLAGADGTVFKDAAGNVTDDADAAASTCVTADDGVIEEILEDPSEYYVNVHTDAHPGGAIRGQLHTIG
jgi:hypothetical protein